MKCLLRWIAWLLFAAAVAPARADDPSKQPQFRIEAGMHTEMISRMGVDAAGRYLVTGSDDKTARVWEIPTGRLLRTLHPPIGRDDEGKIYAVALSPDGNTVACGGSTGVEWDQSVCVYLFDRRSGQMLQRITGLPRVIYDLAYSPDGRFLAVLMGGNGGLRVYRTSDNTQVANDTDYGNRSYSADFDRQGRLVTASYDGYLRLYGSDFKLLVRQKAPDGAWPHIVRFSPDGSKLAVGCADTGRVDVLSGRDLSLLYRPDMSGSHTGALGIVCWSTDGSALYAAGRYGLIDDFLIRRWLQAGQGSAADLEAEAHSPITDLRPLASGSILYSTRDPAFGLVDASGKSTLLQKPATADYRADLKRFLVSADGSTVQFSYIFGGKQPARFSLDALLLDLVPPDAAGPQQGLHAPLLRAPGLQITDWREIRAPKLNGTPLSLKPGEVSISIAIAPDRQSFLLGTPRTLYSFDAQGKRRWQVAVPGAVWDINVSGDSKLGVAACSDGAIRWYRMADGKELLDLFPHVDTRRWVLWTPSGYYACSPGGADLIGWHVNNGKDQAATFFPASRFRHLYYRPDVIVRVLQTQDEAESLRQADAAAGRESRQVSIEQALPPVIHILSPVEDSTISTAQVSLKYTLNLPSGEPVTDLRVLVDGRPLQTSRSLQVVTAASGASNVKEMTLTLPTHDCNLSLIASNRFAVSSPATVHLRWAGQVESDLLRPKLYVLSIGVSHYNDASLSLAYAAKDAADFAGLLAGQKGKLYSDVVEKTLTDSQATKDNILDGLDWLQHQATSRDVAMLYLAGHGYNAEDGDYYFIPADFDLDKVKRTGLPFTEVTNTLRSIAGKALLFVDTCHAGNILGGIKTRGLGPDLTGAINELSSAENGTVVFAASTGREEAKEATDWGHGAFTLALLEGLSGKADLLHSGRITLAMLDLYIEERVKALTQGTQHPTMQKPLSVADFPVAIPK